MYTLSQLSFIEIPQYIGVNLHDLRLDNSTPNTRNQREKKKINWEFIKIRSVFFYVKSKQ